MSPEQRLRRLEQHERFTEIAGYARRAGIDPYELEVSLNEIEALIAQLGGVRGS